MAGPVKPRLQPLPRDPTTLGDTLGRIAFYVGIPTEEFRTVQSELARMTGHVMRVTYRVLDESGSTYRVLDESGSSVVVAPHPIVYEPLIRGASAYGSVFGYWTSGAGADVCR